ncbi:MAG: NAD-dependent epimerase/dehydratase family protein [Bacteroidales bacterium]|jgi:dihydroflavonol-4-reductase|nr:NAD-dependent epimerase/dehydratase family protein [Bacteroidales bacterium]
MRIAVTGANGHVGINLCKSLLGFGHQVNALFHRNSRGIKEIPVNLFKGDILDYQSIKLLLENVDVVFHLAARISITGDPDGMVTRINTEGTHNILNLALECGVKRFIHFSSIHAFQQQPKDKSLDESRPLVSQGGFAYDRSKATGERAVIEAVKNGLDAVILSPTAIIGPVDPQPSLTGKAIIDLYNHKIPSLVPGGYDWVDVRDVVSAAITAMDKGRTGEKYLLSGQWHSLKEFSTLIQEYSGRKIVGTILPLWLARFGLPFISIYSKMSRTEPLYTNESLTIITEGSRMISNAKACKELDFNPRPLSDTIRDMIDWLKESGNII